MGRSRRLAGSLVAVAASLLLVLLAWNGLKASVSDLIGLVGIHTTVENRFFNHQEFLRSLSALVLAEKQVTETLERTERFDGWVSSLFASEAVYEVRYTVLYSFSVDANPKKWTIRDTPEGVAVIAPRLTLREPAIDTATIRVKYRGGWLVFNQRAKAEALRDGLTADAWEKASQHFDQPLLALCRESLKQFLSAWLRHLGDTRDITSIEFTR